MSETERCDLKPGALHPDGWNDLATLAEIDARVIRAELPDTVGPATLDLCARALRIAGAMVRDAEQCSNRVYDTLAPLVPESERNGNVVHLAEKAAALRDLLAELTDPDPCNYDHHGYCQAHHLDPRPCPHERANALLSEVEA